MTPFQAAKRIGVTVDQVRYLVRNKILPATKVILKNNNGKRCGFVYNITEEAAAHYKQHRKLGRPQSKKVGV